MEENEFSGPLHNMAEGVQGTHSARKLGKVASLWWIRYFLALITVLVCTIPFQIGEGRIKKEEVDNAI